MSFNTSFGEDLERTPTVHSSNYKDFPEFERLSGLIDNSLLLINKTHLAKIKTLLNHYEDSSSSKKHEIGIELTQELSTTTEAFKELNGQVKDLTNYIKSIESGNEDIEVVNYLKQKENLLIKLIKNSLINFKKYQKSYESYQIDQLPNSSLPVNSTLEHQLQEQTQVQITYEPINAEQLEQQTIEIEEREREIRQIQEDTQEINEIFSNLSSIINEQQFQVDNIENNLFNYSNEVRNASTELRKAERYQKRSGGRMLCCLFILLGVFGFIILVSVIF